MRIESPEVKKILHDYDISFSSGVILPLTIDKELGDTIHFNDEAGAIQINLSAKPSKTSPDHILPEENITIYSKHIAIIQHRVREVIEPSPEEKLTYIQTWKNLATPKGIM